MRAALFALLLLTACREQVIGHGGEPDAAPDDWIRLDAAIPPADSGMTTAHEDAAIVTFPDATPAEDAEAPLDSGADAGIRDVEVVDAGPCNGVCPSPLVCDTNSGNCVEACRVGNCPTGQVCDANSGLCVGAPACSGSSAQPDSCQNGQVCNETVCEDVPFPNCRQFDPGAHPLVWEATDNTPVIYSMTTLSVTANPTDDQWCEQHGFSSNDPMVRFRGLVEAYWLNDTFPAPGQVATILHLVHPNGSEANAANVIESVTVTNNGHNLSFILNECRAPPTSGVTMALHFAVQGVSGNEFCGVIQ
jgi:hypothetical protein